MEEKRNKCSSIFVRLYDEYFPNSTLFKNSEKIGKNVEKSIFNQTIRNCKEMREIVAWENPRFRQEYYNIYKKVRANLTITPNSPLVREKLKNKKFKPTDMAKMTHRELAPEMWEQAELDMEEIFQKRLIGAAKITAEDHKGAYQCGKCRSWRTTYTQRQVRSSDEPMSVFCLCENCGNRWRF